MLKFSSILFSLPFLVDHSFQFEPDIIDIIRPFNVHEHIYSTTELLNTTLGQVYGCSRKIDYAPAYRRNNKLKSPHLVQSWYQIPYGFVEERFTKPVDYPGWEGINSHWKFDPKKVCYQSGEGSG